MSLKEKPSGFRLLARPLRQTIEPFIEIKRLTVCSNREDYHQTGGQCHPQKGCEFKKGGGGVI